MKHTQLWARKQRITLALDESRQVHDILEDHPVDHLDIVVPDEAGGPGGGQHGVVDMSALAGVHNLGWASR